MQAPYHLIPLGIITFLLYFMSHILVQLKVWPKNTHRKLWNSVLLLVFVSTAVFGILLAIQINYKLEWNFIKKILKWHVDIGIVLSIVATIHLIWHFSYYINLFKTKKTSRPDKEKNQNPEITDSGHLRTLIFLSGFAGTIIQVLIIRELVTLFEGNEFMMGWTLGIWMLLTGSGAYLGKKFNHQNINTDLLHNIILIVVTFAPVLFILLDLFKNTLFLPGVMVSPLLFILINVLILVPICLLTGLIFALFVRSVQTDKKYFIRVYMLESLGSVAGGLIISFVLINWFTVLQSLFILLFLVTVALFFLNKARNTLLTGIPAGIIIVLLFFTPLENIIRSKVFTNQKILENKETFFGNITVTQQAGEFNFFSNGSLIFSSGNFIVSEEYAHYALLQCNNPERVLIVSGGVSGIVNEVLKYSSVKQVDCVEINPKLIGLGRKYGLLPEDPRVKLIYDDAKRYLTRTKQKYDAVIMAVPSPTSLQINRYYTDEYLSVLKKRLNVNGIIIYGLSSTGNYLSNVQADKLSVMFNTLKKHFSTVKILPGEKDYLLASDSVISLAISELYSNNDIVNSYVNSDYIDDISNQMRSDLIVENLPDIQTINAVNRPIPVFYNTLRYTSQFYSTKNKLIYLLLLILILPLFFMKPESAGMYVTGLSGASLEILLIFAFQIYFGYLYSAIGIIVALFMTGLVIGSVTGYRWKRSHINLTLLQAGLMLYLILLPFVLKFFQIQTSSVLFWIVYILITLIPTVIIGYYYVTASSLQSSKTDESAPTVYAADLIGSSLGIILSTILLVPLLGITITCYILAGLNFLTGIYYRLHNAGGYN